MQVTVSRVSPVEITLHVALPQARVSTALERAYNELGKRAQLRGFRPGKVPRALLKQYFGARVQEDVLKSLVNETLPNAIRESRVEPIAEPMVESDSELTGAADWSYTARLEVRPEIADIDFARLTLTRKVYEIHDHEIDDQVARKREQAATLRTPEPARAAAKGDSVTFDYDVTLDGELRAELGATGRTVELGKGALLADLENALHGMSAGESRSVDVTFPTTHRNPDIAGKTATVKVTLSEVQEKVLPELDDEFARDVGSESLEALRASIRTQIENDNKERSEDELRNDAIEMLVAQNEITPPPSLVEQVYNQMRQEAASTARMLGRSEDDLSASTLRDESAKRVKAGLLLTEIARKNSLQVTDTDLEARLQQMAAETQRAVQRLRVEYRDAKKREMLVATILEDKVLGLILSRATVTEVAASSHEHDHSHEHSEAPAAPSHSEPAKAE